jgi:hypothetical protein
MIGDGMSATDGKFNLVVIQQAKKFPHIMADDVCHRHGTHLRRMEKTN